MCAEGRGAVISGTKRDKTPGSQLESALGETFAGRVPVTAHPPRLSNKVGELNNRGLLRRSVAAMAAVLAVTAGLLTPAGPALATEATQAGAIATESTESTAEPAIELEPEHGRGNTVTITMTNGIGLTARLNITIDGKDSVWTAPAPATTAKYTIVASYGATVTGMVRLQAVALKSGTEVAWGGNWTVWGQPAPPPAPPAAPVAQTIYVSDNRDSGSAAKTLIFSGWDTGRSGSTIALQRKDSSGWKTVWTSPQLASTQPEARFAAYTFKSEGSASFRALLINAGKTLATSSPLTLTYRRQPTYVVALPGGSLGKPFSTANGRVAARTQWSQAYALNYDLTNRTGHLQEYRGGKWVNLQTLTFTKANKYFAVAKTPLTVGTVTRKYRVTVDTTARQKSWTSPTSTIEHVDPARYTGYTKASYDYMKRFCPNQVITLIPGTWSYAWSPSRQIQIATGLPDQTSLKFVSLHECAHILSYKVYADNYSQLANRMNAIYGTRTTPGVEQLADCMASAMGGDLRRSGYRTTNCTGARADAARKILAGKKP